LTIATILGALLLSAMSAQGTVSPCIAGARAAGNRQFEIAQPLLWQCVVTEERTQQDTVSLTLTYRALKNYADGMKRVDAALKQMPDNEDLHYISAFLLFRTQQFSQSIDELSVAYRMKQDDWRVHQLLAMDFIEERGNKSDSYAEQEFARAIKLNPQNAEAYYLLSRLYYTQQRFSEAIAASSRAILISPNYAEAYDSLALSYQATGDVSRAVEGFSQAINITAKAGNTDPWPYINYGVFLEDQSPRTAIPLLKQAIAIDPRNPDANYHLGRCLNDIGQLTESESYYERTIEIDASYDRAYYALSRLLRVRDPVRSAELLRRFKELTHHESAH
jgi:tetratricopeptide (TPR) repeat protein